MKKKYFLYELKSNLAPFLVMVAFGICSYIIPLLTERYRWGYTPETYLEYCSAAFGIMCAVLPIWFFRYKMNKRSVNLYYAQPITRTDLLGVKFAVGAILIFAAYTLVYCAGFIIALVKYQRLLYPIYYLWQYLSSLIPLFTLYALSSFIFTRANNILDGILFIFFATFSIYLVLYVIDSLLPMGMETFPEGSYEHNRKYSYLVPYDFLPFHSLDETTAYFMDKILKKQTTFLSFDRPSNIASSVNSIVGMSFWTLAGVAATIALFKTEKTRKAETCMQVSDSVFGYKTALPVFCFAGCTLVEHSIIYFFLVILAAYLLSAVYKKSFRIGWRQAIVVAASAAIGFAIGLIP